MSGWAKTAAAFRLWNRYLLDHRNDFEALHRKGFLVYVSDSLTLNKLLLGNSQFCIPLGRHANIDYIGKNDSGIVR